MVATSGFRASGRVGGSPKKLADAKTVALAHKLYAGGLKMVLVISTVGQPRGRGQIERLFQSVAQLFPCTLPGYVPAGTLPSQPDLTLAWPDERLHQFRIEEYYHRVHGETGTAEQIDLLLLTGARARRVLRDGSYCQGLRYLDLTVAAYAAEEVTIRYDPGDRAEIRVYHLDRFPSRADRPDWRGRISRTVALSRMLDI